MVAFFVNSHDPLLHSYCTHSSFGVRAIPRYVLDGRRISTERAEAPGPGWVAPARSTSGDVALDGLHTVTQITTTTQLLISFSGAVHSHTYCLRHAGGVSNEEAFKNTFSAFLMYRRGRSHFSTFSIPLTSEDDAFILWFLTNKIVVFKAL